MKLFFSGDSHLFIIGVSAQNLSVVPFFLEFTIISKGLKEVYKACLEKELLRKGEGGGMLAVSLASP